MKKLIAIAIATFVLLGVSVISYADPVETSKNVTVDLTIDSLFGFQLWDTELAQNLGNIVAGGGATGNLHFTCHTNHDVVWYIQGSSTGLSGPGTVIPIVMTTYNGAGTGVTDLTLTGTAANIYTAGATEYPAINVAFDGLFAVTAAADQQQGAYSGTIVLSMTE